MTKKELLKRIETLMYEIDYCNRKFVLARMNCDEDGVQYAHAAMESLQVRALQELTFVADYFRKEEKI